MTTYRDRVQYICDSLGIQNPIKEEDLTVQSLSFRTALIWRKIDANEMNRAGRLFFQYCYACSLKPVTSGKRRTMGGVTTDGLREIGKYHFGELWDDAEEKNRTLIAAFKKSERVQIYFK